VPISQKGGPHSGEQVTHPIPPVALPFERWGIDFLQNLTTTRSENNHVITLIDYCTRWVIAKPVPRMTAEEVIKFLYNDVILNYGVPFEIISDRGSAFLSDSVQQFFNSYQIKHLASTPYHPQTNGMVESMHRMLNHAITCAVDGDPTRWDEEIGKAVFALRVRSHAVTKVSPFKLLYGTNPRVIGDFLGLGLMFKLRITAALY
jgi:transposase InsO family protein